MSGRIKASDIAFYLLLALCVAAAVVFGVPSFINYGDERLSRLVCDGAPRFAVAVAVAAVIVRSGRGAALEFKPRDLPRALLWCLPCFAVAFANFPYTALAHGDAVIERADLIGLFLFKCLSIALMEELFFRAVLVPFALSAVKKRRYGTTLAVITSSAVFAAMHFINLFFGMSAADVFLQVGYTFLIGCMLAVTLIVTKNVWICVAVHFIFDIGGAIVTDLGSGAFWDFTFWVLTAVAAAACTAHCVIALVRLERAAPRPEHTEQTKRPEQSEQTEQTDSVSSD